MPPHTGFLKASSVAVKIAAWIFLLLGFIGGIPLILGLVPDRPRLLGASLLLIYGFLFFFLYFVAKIADAVVNLDTRGQGSEKE